MKQNQQKEKYSFLRRIYRSITIMRRDERGATALEFAMVAPLFIAMLFMIIQLAIIFWIEQVLDHATGQVARLVRTGQAHAMSTPLTADNFRDKICENMAGAFNCTSKVHVTVQNFTNYPDRNTITTLPIDQNGDLIQPLPYDIGGPRDVVIVRAFYRWEYVLNPISFLKNMGFGASSSGSTGTAVDDYRILVSTIAFTNEPF